MSNRALRRLRGDDHLPVLLGKDEASSSGGSDEDDSVTDEPTPRKNMFCFSSDEEASSSSSDEEEEEIERSKSVHFDEKQVQKNLPVKSPDQEKVEEFEEENIDDILAEYAAKDDRTNISPSDDTSFSSNIILSGVNPKSLDLDFNLRSILGHDAARAHMHEPDEQQGGRQRGRRGIARQRPRQGNAIIGKKLYFGKPRDDWSRPPSFVGGGMGMEVLSDDVAVPQPYAILQDYQNAQWHQFIQSDTYATMEAEFERVANIGDVNMLAMFVAQNPFCASALLQFAMVLVHTGNMEQGTELLRRSIFVYEYASIPSLFGSLLNNISCSNVLVDSNKDENRSFLSALFRLMQISCMVGCLETALSVSRFLLSLDPLRDPMGVLLTLDYFALATVKSPNTKFIIDLVESETIKIFHDNETPADLIDLPNFAFNFALALHRLALENELTDNFDESLKAKANDALENALYRYPEVLILLLEKNGVDTRGRSFQIDWPTVIPFFEIMNDKRKNTKPQVISHIVNIFVQRSHKLWSSDETLKWLYDISVEVMNRGIGESKYCDYDDRCLTALNRYNRCDPSDYEDRFKTLPAEANPLDPALVAPALAVDPNRRMMRRNRALNNAIDGVDEMEVQRMLFEQMEHNGALIDPDSPLLEVFLHSLMPWAQVDGVNHQQRPG